MKIPKLNLININNIEDKHQYKLETELIKNENIVNYNQNINEKSIKTKVNNFQNFRNINISFPKQITSNLEINSNSYNKSIKRIKSNNKIKIRNGLFSERFFTKTYKEKEEIGKLTDRLKLSKKLNSLKLPFLGDKIIFKKGEIEKLLNYQFYNTSYRACCQISQYNNIPNTSMKANYKNNWNIVTNYVNEIRGDDHKNSNKNIINSF